MPVIYQINLQRTFGGGEVYTRFFTQALQANGYQVVLFIAKQAGFWRDLGLSQVELHAVDIEDDILTLLPHNRCIIFTHTACGTQFAKIVSARHVLAGLMHMPLYERLPDSYRFYTRLLGVSKHVIASARSRGLVNVDDTPMYAVADLAPRKISGALGVQTASVYDWDQRKFRDRLLSFVYPLRMFLRKKSMFQRRPGLTLAVVSRITPIKQFPLLFSLLAPILKKYPQVQIEFFGAGGYASVRDLRKTLWPVRQQVRFWGQQQDVASIYANVDAVLSGLPEKEALGLNLLEAQAFGRPVIAVNAAPFTETVYDGVTGYLYTDPRQDSGLGFEQLLQRLLSEQVSQLQKQNMHANAHLARFSKATFERRVNAAVLALAAL